MSILDVIDDELLWADFLCYKKDKGNLRKRELTELENFVIKKEYLQTAKALKNGEYPFAIPQKKLVNKMGSDKKRVVYSFSYCETAVLKLISFLLYRYDDRMTENLFSFRKNFGVKRAIKQITQNNNRGYCYKLDIKDYFNSIDISLLLPKLKNILIDDDKLYYFFERLLSEDKAVFDGETIDAKRGVMAGTPVSPFLANVFLIDLDAHFSQNGILYARYSDDIIAFADSVEELTAYADYIKNYLTTQNLSVNPSKEQVYLPSDNWEYLGISYDKKSRDIDLSGATVEKIKGKIRRKCRALYRWKIRKNATTENAVKAAIKSFNKKFYETALNSELTWCRWFFPILTVDTSLKNVDTYLEENLRYIATGKHAKKNFEELPYEKLKELGFRPLVKEFWQYKRSELNKV